MIKILLIGSGAREHAIAKTIKKSQHKSELYCWATNYNPGIIALTKDFTVGKVTDIDASVTFALKHNIDFAIVGPEAALAAGITDALNVQKIAVIGPTKQLACIETSKAWARNLLKKHNINISPQCGVFGSLVGVEDFLLQLGDNYVVKADGLKSGKGVKISGEHLLNHQQALNYCQELITENSAFVIEEKLIGEEFSLLSFCDGKSCIHMPPVRDHKRAFVGDLGPNTGGMGSYTCANHLLPFLTADDIKQAQSYNETTVKVLHQETGAYYKGILYGGYIRTKDGVKLIEYNARFGDPEAINILALLNTDFIDICQAIIKQKLDTIKAAFLPKASVCKYIVPKGYPDKPMVDEEIDIAALTQLDNIYFASVNAKNGKIYTTTSRSLALLGIADTIAEAEQQAESMAAKIKGEVFYREDIGRFPLRVAILASGRGSIIPALLNEIKAKQINAEIKIIISNNPDAPVLKLAQKYNIKAQCVPHKNKDRRQHEQEIEMLLKNIDIILSIGYMRILTADFVNKWPNRILNVHPSLLPNFAGLMDLDVHRAVIAAKKKQTGCTVHIVTPTLDAGPIVVQKPCAVAADDTPEKLKKKVQALEPIALAEALTKLIKRAK